MATIDISCPYCGEAIQVVVDCSAGPQEYVEDCQVCCRPMDIAVTFAPDGAPVVNARRDDD